MLGYLSLSFTCQDHDHYAMRLVIFRSSQAFAVRSSQVFAVRKLLQFAVRKFSQFAVRVRSSQFAFAVRMFASFRSS